MVSASERRKAVEYARGRGMSERRAGALLNIGRSSLHYAERKPGRDAEIAAKVKELSVANPRFGYRRITELLRRAGGQTNPKRVYRLWRQNGLAIKRKPAYRRRHGGQHRWMNAIAPNGVWAYDFVFDACANGQKLKCLTVIDEYTRESLAIDVGARIRSGRVIEVLGRLFALRGPPAHLRSDNGSEFVAKAVQAWLESQGVATAYIKPGRPWQNGAAESFNSKFRDECLNMEWFHNRREATVLIEEWRVQYNTKRPHSGIGYRTPAEAREMFMKIANNYQQPLQENAVA